MDMRLAWVPTALGALLLAAGSARAGYMDMGLQSVWAAQTQMAANPPLPMLRYPKGAWRLSLQPAYFLAKPGVSESLQKDYAAGGRLRGGGGGFSFSYAFAEKWGIYLWGLGSDSWGRAALSRKPSCPTSTCSDLSSESILS